MTLKLFFILSNISVMLLTNVKNNVFNLFPVLDSYVNYS